MARTDKGKRVKKATKARHRAEKKIAEDVGPERSRVSKAASPRVEEFILEQAREVREKRHGRISKLEIVALGRARARGEAAVAPPRGGRGKSRVKENGANAYHKGLGEH